MSSRTLSLACELRGWGRADTCNGTMRVASSAWPRRIEYKDDEYLVKIQVGLIQVESTGIFVNGGKLVCQKHKDECYCINDNQYYGGWDRPEPRREKCCTAISSTGVSRVSCTSRTNRGKASKPARTHNLGPE